MSIEPQDMYEHLAGKAAASGRAGAGDARVGADGMEAAPAPPHRPSPEPGLSDPALKALLESIAASYFSLRIGLALLAFAFPILLWLLTGGETARSISAYYHEDAASSGLLGRAPRDIFVGVLCAIGAFLWLYKGYRRRENMALNLAGLAAVMIALFPTDLPKTTTLVGLVHKGAAFGYFMAIAYVCLWEAKHTLGLLNDPALERMYRAAYNLLGTAMVVLPSAVLAIHVAMAETAEETKVIYWLEFVAIYVFAAFWLVKSLEIRTIRRRSETG